MRPTLPDNKPSEEWRSQPRLAHPPPNHNIRGPPPPFRPHMPPHHHPQHGPPRHPMEPKKPLTYGEYRRLRQEAERRHQERLQGSQPQPSQVTKPPQQQPTVNKRDPRRRQQDSPSEPEISTKSEPSSSSSLGKFKIPKKKKEPPETEELTDENSGNKLEPETQKVESSPKPETNDESDSEPELKIAESDHEEEKKEEDKSAHLLEKEPEKDENNEEKSGSASTDNNAEKPPNVDEKSQENESKEVPKDDKERGQLTKAMLQNIVASIDTKEASKLLERATRLLNSDDGNHKLSLKQLLVGDSSDSETEELEKPVKSTTTTSASAASTSGKKKGRAPVVNKKPVKQPTPGKKAISHNKAMEKVCKEHTEVQKRQKCPNILNIKFFW